jgi:hypothetical protein
MDERSPAHSPGHDERREFQREPVRIAAKAIFGPKNDTIDCTIIDRSVRGMRIRLSPNASVPIHFTLIEPATGAAHQVTAVWKAYPDVGLSIRESFNIRFANTPAAKQLQRIWRDLTNA